MRHLLVQFKRHLRALFWRLSWSLGLDRKPFIIASGGAPRSGTTWVYNVTRMIVERAGLRCHAAWHLDYDPETIKDSHVHLIKLHRVKDLTFPADRVLTTRRVLRERLASLIRMEWVDPDPERIRAAARAANGLTRRWARRADCIVLYKQIIQDPEQGVLHIAASLGLPCSHRTALGIVAELQRLPEPKKGEEIDPTTQLHPNHRASEEDRQKYLDIVDAALADKDGQSGIG